jgi:hypothetical protein
MDDKIRSIYKNDVWQLTDLPLGQQAITTKWIYWIKTHANGTPTKLKAQLVAKGFQQQEGWDFEETYALVVKYNNIQTLSTILGHKN